MDKQIQDEAIKEKFDLILHDKEAAVQELMTQNDELKDRIDELERELQR